MTRLTLKELPRYECLLEMSRRFPQLNPTACATFLSLLRTGDELMRVGNVFFGKHNLSQGRFLVLVMLIDRGDAECAPRTPADLAEQACCTRATMTGLIDTLVRDGLVHREPSPDDRRVMKLSLTNAGMEFLNSILPEHFERITDLMSALSEEECRTLLALLTKVSERSARLEPLAKPTSSED